MNTLTALHGPTALVFICALLFVEETGVPVPLLSGDVLLVLAGILIVKGSISPWTFFPPAFVAEVVGVMIAHFWSRTIGHRGLEIIADKLRARKALERTTVRLGRASPLHITVARLVPGLRINTSLVAGAAGVPRGTFFVGVVPAIIIWLGAYTLLGVVIGRPVLATLNGVQHVTVTAVGLLLIGLAVAIGIRYIPSSRRHYDPSVRLGIPLLLTLSIVVDLLIAAGLASTTAVLLQVWFGLHDVLKAAVIVAAMVLVYVAATRRTFGGTAGECLTGMRYGAASR
ncbi:MAG TPA: VTT domain-containing protein [Chloroflexota bacterium]|nr:VTT domain-containing protein [Chloroflexota bacterium]